MPHPVQPDLFAAPDSPAAPPPGAATPHHGLTIAAPIAAALTPEQRRYNELVARVQKSRDQLQAWDEAGPSFARAHALQMNPLMAQFAAQRRQLVLKLADVLVRGRLALRDRQTLERSLCDEAATLVDNEFLDASAVAELAALHDRYADNSLEDERRASLHDMKTMLEAVSGLDLGDAVFESEEDLLRHAQQQVQAAGERGHQFPPSPFSSSLKQHFGRDAAPDAKSAHQAPGADQHTRRQQQKQAQQHKRQQKQAQKQAEEAAQATQSVREVFRKLASALHPDRAQDEADRGRRTALMQRVNQAYEKQDLLALFSLQLEIEQIDPEHLARAGSDRLRHYIRVLNSQLDELKEEVFLREEAFRMEFGIEPWTKLNPRQLGAVLAGEVREIQAALNQLTLRMAMLDQPAGLKRYVKQVRAEQRADGMDPFNLPF